MYTRTGSVSLPPLFVVKISIALSAQTLSVESNESPLVLFSFLSLSSLLSRLFLARSLAPQWHSGVCSRLICGFIQQATRRAYSQLFSPSLSLSPTNCYRLQVESFFRLLLSLSLSLCISLSLLTVAFVASCHLHDHPSYLPSLLFFFCLLSSHLPPSSLQVTCWALTLFVIHDSRNSQPLNVSSLNCLP